MILQKLLKSDEDCKLDLNLLTNKVENKTTDKWQHSAFGFTCATFTILYKDELTDKTHKKYVQNCMTMSV